MKDERTLSIIKPDAVERHLEEVITERFLSSGLRVIAKRRMRLSLEDARKFYDIHQDKPFYESLVASMSSGEILVQVLEGENAIAKNRDIMGATNPKDAAPGTIRADFAKSLEANSVHGSDGAETAKREIAFFFKDQDLS